MSLCASASSVVLLIKQVTGRTAMILHDDKQIDEIIWSVIAGSDFAGNFAAYLRHRPEGNKLLWDVEESDMPCPSDENMDGVVMSISREEIVTKDAEGKITTYLRVESEDAPKESEPIEKVVRLAVRNGNTLGA
jgi:hypothetical protein